MPGISPRHAGYSDYILWSDITETAAQDAMLTESYGNFGLELCDLEVREGRTRVAIGDDRIVGFATWLSAGDIFEIEDLFVEPERMGQGIGRALVLDVIAIARGHGVGRVEVTANQHALAFYERVGFVVEDEVTTGFGPAPRMGMDIAS